MSFTYNVGTPRPAINSLYCVCFWEKPLTFQLMKWALSAPLSLFSLQLIIQGDVNMELRDIRSQITI